MSGDYECRNIYDFEDRCVSGSYLEMILSRPPSNQDQHCRLEQARYGSVDCSTIELSRRNGRSGRYRSTGESRLEFTATHFRTESRERRKEEGTFLFSCLLCEPMNLLIHFVLSSRLESFFRGAFPLRKQI